MENKPITLKTIKEYLPLIVLIPTVIGGAFQLIQLTIINPSFIRLYSISQALTDGLFSLFFILSLSLLIWMLQFLKPVYENFTYIVLERIPLKFIRLLIQFFIILIAHAIFIFFIISCFLLFVHLNMPLVEILSGILSLSLLIAFISALYSLIKSIRKKKGNNGQIHIKNKSTDSTKWRSYITSYSVLVFVLLILINHANTSFTDSRNNDNLFCFLDTIHFKSSVKEYRLLYFNDKFVFVKIFFEEENIKPQKIALEFKTLFDFNSCKKEDLAP